jgi:O-methyltransferase
MRIETLYLESLKNFLTRNGFEPEGTWAPIGNLVGKETGIRSRFKRAITFAETFLLPANYRLAQRHPFDPDKRWLGLDHPIHAETMIGLERLNQFHEALITIQEEAVPGNILEAGIWRGGAVIFAAQYLNVWQIPSRTVFACDSFEGLPRPEMLFPADAGDSHYTYDHLSVSLERVKENFSSYLVPMDRVVFVKGFFSETLQDLECGQLAILRLDGDMYSSTIQTLDCLFDRVSPGGFIIIDDWRLPGAQKAVKDFLKTRDLDPKIHEIKGSGAYFRLPK